VDQQDISCNCDLQILADSGPRLYPWSHLEITLLVLRFF